MKKILLIMLCAMMSMAGMAQMTKPFEDNLVVTINGESTAPQKTTVYLTLNEDNTCDFSLNNFMLDGGDGNLMPVGNIFIPGLPLTPSEEGYYTFSYEGNLVITEGDLEGYDTWLGPLLGEIPLKLTGKATMDKVYVTIDIDMMESIGQIIYVTFGSDFGSADDLGMPFTDDLVVTINGESTTPQQTTVYLSLNEDNTCNFVLPNFMLDGGDGNMMPVGNIVLKNLPLAPNEEGYYTFSYDGALLISEGNIDGYDTWLGPLLGEIPLKLKGKASMDKVYVTIDIDMMESIGQIIYVTFGSDFESYNPPTPTTYALTFVVDGQTVSSAELEEGTSITYPTVDPREGYTFAWDKQLVNMPAEATTITGTYTVNNYKLTYMVDGVEYASSQVNYGTALIAIDAPAAKEGYTFSGWSELPETMPAKDVTITGSFTINTYVISYYVNDVLVYSDSLEYGAAVSPFGYEEQEGYTFSGWDEEPATMPAKDVKVSATETVNTYKVTYMVGDSVLATFDVNYGAEMPEAPEYTAESDDRYQRTFEGWNGETYETMPAKDVTYTAIVNVVDAIKGIAAEQNAKYYDLNGRRTVKAGKGLYIVNGKVVLKK